LYGIDMVGAVHFSK